jgi:polysaccharide export outer membrane protein
MKNILPGFFYLFIIAFVVTASSCNSIKNYKYFEDISDSAKTTQIINNTYKEPLIQADDILYIAIQTIDPMAGSTINALNAPAGIAANASSLLSSSSITGNQSNIYGNLVDKHGLVKIPVLGELKLEGLTTAQARDLITERADQFYKDPSVIVRFANFKITVLGEVQRPGTYAIPNEKLTVLDALGYAGDLTIYGIRTNILLIRRQSDGSMITARLNINSSSLLKSPYFYLQQNDELYIEPSHTKITGSDAAQVRNISIISGALSVLIVLLTRIK